MSHAVRFDAQRNVADLGGTNMVFHCHFYNCTLQRALETGMGDRARGVLKEAALPAVRTQLGALAPKGASPSEVMSIAATLFSELGFGRFAPIALDAASGGEVIVSSSHYAMGWLSIYGERPTPACHFVEGFIEAAVERAFGKKPGDVQVHEHRCFACGHDDCRFRVEVRR